MTKTKIGSLLFDERRHFETIFLAGNDHVIDIFTSEDIEITSWLTSAYDFYSRVVKDRTSERSERVSLIFHNE